MKYLSLVCISTLFFGCGGGSDDDSDDGVVPVVDNGISPSDNADLGSSYSNSTTDIYVSNFSIPGTATSGNLRDAIAYLDADGDGDTDVFIATGEYLLEGEVDSILALNDGFGNFTASTSEFNDDMPPATHARKSIVSDFNNDGLQDIFVFDHGFDADPFPGSQPKLIIQDSVGSFSWQKLTAQTGFHHGGASADIDNDGDIDVFVGGNDPFFFINDGNTNFSKVDDRFDNSINKVFAAELIDVDQDGYIDLLLGAHERDGDQTSIYWGSSSGSYSESLRLIIPTVASYGAILDFDAEDFDGDGNRDLVINRTRDGDDGSAGGFYQGRNIQLLLSNGGRSFSDVTSTNIDDPGTNTDLWFPWVRAQDMDNDGDIDFAPDDAAQGFGYINDGSGFFIKSEL